MTPMPAIFPEIDLPVAGPDPSAAPGKEPAHLRDPQANDALEAPCDTAANAASSRKAAYPSPSERTSAASHQGARMPALACTAPTTPFSTASSMSQTTAAIG